MPPDGYYYLHDNVENRVSTLSPNRTAHWQVDAANQLQAQTALSHRRNVGTVNEPSLVEINGYFVSVGENLSFECLVDSLQTRNVIIEATDADDNVTTEEFRFTGPENTVVAMLLHDAYNRLLSI